MECCDHNAASCLITRYMVWVVAGIETGCKHVVLESDLLEAVKLIIERRDCSNLNKNLVQSCKELMGQD